MDAPTLDWGSLLTTLAAQRPSPAAHVIEAFGDVAAPDVARWRAAVDAYPLRVVVRSFKPPQTIAELDPMARSVYARVLQWLPTDAAVQRVVAEIEKRSRAAQSSGRVMDALVTRFATLYPERVRYWLDVTDPDAVAIRYTAPPRVPDGRVYHFFDLGASYRSKLTLFSKRYFDCFQRDRLVRHPLRGGGEVTFSLCQMVFYTWALRFGVFDFLADHLAEVRGLRKARGAQVAKKRAVRPSGTARLEPRSQEPHVRLRARPRAFVPLRPLYRLEHYVEASNNTRSRIKSSSP